MTITLGTTVAVVTGDTISATLDSEWDTTQTAVASTAVLTAP